MKVFLTGSTGFVGKALYEQLIKEGHTIYCYSRGQEIDLKDSSIVIHCAAEIYKENLMVESNILLTERLLREAEKKRIQHFVYLGSSSEYGGRNYPMSERDLLVPTNLYEATKGCGNLLTMSSKLTTTIIRLFSVYGPNEPERRFIPLIYNAAMTNGHLTVDLFNHDFIYIDDVIDIILFAIKKSIIGIINAGTGIQHNNIEVVQLMEKVMGKKINYTITAKKLKPHNATYWQCDTTYLKSIYDKPLIIFEEGLKKYVQFRQKNSTY